MNVSGPEWHGVRNLKSNFLSKAECFADTMDRCTTLYPYPFLALGHFIDYFDDVLVAAEE